MSQAVQILEYVAGTAAKVDREAGVVRGVKILGPKSANGRRYLAEAMAKARGLYEGRAVNVNHSARSGEGRSAYDRFGRTVNVRTEPDGLYGDLEYLKAHPMAAAFVEAAERMPSLFGLSHNARGRERRENGEAVIESIDEVVSVDLVSDPATVAGIFESRGNDVTTKLKDLLESLKGKPQGVALKEMADAAGMSPDATVPGADAAKPDDAIKAGFKAAIHAVVDDDSLELKAKMAKIKDILKAQEKLMGGGSSSSADASAAPAAEGRVMNPDAERTLLREQLELLKRKDRARELCEAANVKPSPALLKALVALPDEADVKALIEEHKGPPARPGAGGTGKPQSKERAPLTPVLESRNGNAGGDVGQAPDDPKALAGWLNSK